MGFIQLKNIKKSFDRKKILKGIDLEIPEASFSVLLGPSGCGKSTLLRILAGLEKQDSGEILMNENPISDLEPKDRKIAMVFQNYALYPHMTVFKNIEYGLKIQKIEKKEREEIVNNALELVELEEHTNKLPGQMSGGQRQRVALARAIVKSPEVFLMDEPLSNLDAKLRNQMRSELIGMHKKLNSTYLYVTHDQVEAMSMGTNIVVMNEGEIMQVGTPKDIYDNPKNLFVAQFIGSPPTNIIKIEDEYIGIRPENIEIYNENYNKNMYWYSANIESVEQLGGETIYHVNSKLGNLKIKGPACWNDLDKKIMVGFLLEDLKFFDKNGNSKTILSNNILNYINNKSENVNLV